MAQLGIHLDCIISSINGVIGFRVLAANTLENYGYLKLVTSFCRQHLTYTDTITFALSVKLLTLSSGENNPQKSSLHFTSAGIGAV